MRLYFENPVGRVLEHPDGYALVQYAKGPRQLATFQAFLTHTHQLLRRHGWHKMLADQRNMAAYTTEERDWITTKWLSQSAQDGYQLYGAIIIPGDALHQASVSKAIDAVQEQSALRYRLFKTEEEATNWLRQLP